jgi:hypothetical protein
MAEALRGSKALEEPWVIDFLHECVTPNLKQERDRWPAALEAIQTLAGVPSAVAVSASIPTLLTLLAGLDGISGAGRYETGSLGAGRYEAGQPLGPSRYEPLHDHIIAIEKTLDKFITNSPEGPRTLVRKELKRLVARRQQLTPKSGEPEQSEARFHLIELLAKHSDVLSIPYIIEEIKNGFDERDWKNAEASLSRLAEVAQKIARTSTPPPKGLPDSGEVSRLTLHHLWHDWWEKNESSIKNQLAQNPFAPFERQSKP